MRPLRLDMEGFGTFSRATAVDFTGADFFALVGTTGAGKSTVLDAMCFALYGRVPRWGAGIEYALAPSATTGKVRLVFGADSRVYVATRVVKRGAKGKVTTASAALERLPADVDVADLGEVGSLIGTALAGSAKGVSEHVERIIGLPFDQFTKCVLLPQGAFAEFLHSSAAERRKILENLLGYTVYRDIQSAAGEEQKAAEAVLAHLDHQLAGLATVTDEALRHAGDRIEELTGLVGEIRAKVPAMEVLALDAAAAAEALKSVDEEQSLLTYIRRPADVDSIAGELADATAEVAAARAEVLAVEQAEERLRAMVSDTDVTAIDALLADHDTARDLAGKVATGTRLTAEAQAAHGLALNERDACAKVVAGAEQALDEAKTADLAATLRQQLRIGSECPVCTQTVASAPEHSPHDTLEVARRRLSAAREDLTATETRLSGSHKTVADYRARLEARIDEQAALAAKLAHSPSVEQLREERLTAQRCRDELAEAATAVRTNREALRRKESALAKASDRLATEWQKFDHHRDRVAKIGPPPADRGDLAAAWTALAEWAGEQLAERKSLRGEHAAAMAKLDDKTRIIRNELSMLLSESRVPRPRGTAGTDFIDAAAAALNTAQTDQQRLKDQRSRFVELTGERADQSRKAQVAKQLHQHLGTRQFVNWLLSEALDELVVGASQILRQLTSGQYDLAYIDNDFYVVDHHDADLTRPAKTLSGGETFAAALSLALAMSEQLAGMSSRGACLEAILLDEGFGTLDAATLDQVAANLEALAGTGGRMVGVVTHVPGLAERIPVRYEVGKDARGSHVTRVDV